MTPFRQHLLPAAGCAVAAALTGLLYLCAFNAAGPVLATTIAAAVGPAGLVVAAGVLADRRSRRTGGPSSPGRSSSSSRLGRLGSSPASESGSRRASWSGSSATGSVSASSGWPVVVAVALGGVVAAAGLFRSADPLVVVDGVVSGWARAFSAPVPLSTNAELLVVPALHVWITSAALAMLARAKRLGTAWPLAVVAAAIGAALVFAAPTYPSAWLMAAVAAAGLGLVLLGVQRRNGISLRHSASRGGTVIVAAAFVTALVALVVPTGSRAAVRDPDRAAMETISGLNPLVGLKAQLTREPPQPLFQITPAQPGTLVELATLDQFDGTTWTAQGRFGEPAAIAPDFGAGGTVRRYEVTVLGLGGRWVPVPGAPNRIGGVDVRQNPDTGDLLANSPLTDRQRVVLDAVPTAQPGDNEVLRPSIDPVFAGVLRTDAVSPELAAQLDTLLGDGSSPGERLNALQATLVGRFGYGEETPAGHQDALLTHVAAIRRAGTPEHFAAIAGLAARRAGFPSRVVVGFRIPAASLTSATSGTADAPVSSGEPVGPVVVRTSDSYAWVEVATDRGWVAIDVTPPADQTTPPVNDPVDGTDGLSPQPVTPTTTPQLLDSSEPAPASNGSLLADIARTTVLFGPPLLVVALLVSIWLTKRQRRRTRRSAAHPADRVLGAWDEIVDRLIETGSAPNPAHTLNEVCIDLTERQPALAAALAPMTSAVDIAIHAPDLIAAPAADQAWQHSDAVCAELRRANRQALRPYRPIVHAFDPRPLVRNRARRH